MPVFVGCIFPLESEFLSPARMFAITKLSMNPVHVNPEFIFDEGYVTWHEMYPGETEDIMNERNKLTALKDSDPKEYLTAINFWAVERIQCLKDDGWRKAVRSCCQVSFSQNYK